MAEGFDDLLLFSGPRVPLKNNLSIRDIVKGQQFSFEVDEQGAPFECNDDFNSDDEDDRKSNGGKFYEDGNLQIQPVDNSKIRLDEPLSQSFETIEQTMESIHPTEKVKKLITKEGFSDIDDDAKVFVHYAAFAEGKPDCFDSTTARKRPQGFFLGEGCGIPGFLIALRSMKMGEISKFIVHPDLAYGEIGCPPRIPAGAKIYFAIHMVQHIPKEKLNDVFFMSVDDRAQLPFKDILTAANECRRKGNAEYKRNGYTAALREYNRGIIILEDYGTATERENQEREDLITTLYINKAQVLIRLDRAAPACVACKYALKTGDATTRPKALLRFAEAKLMLGSLEDATKYLQECIKLFRKDESVPVPEKCFELKSKIQAAVAREKETDKLLASKMLGLSTSLKETLPNNK